MDRLQKIQLRQSEVRQEIGAILDCEETRSEEDNKKLKTLGTEARQLEGDLQAAMLIHKEPLEVRQQEVVVDGEERELRSLVAKCNVGNIFEAALEHRSTSGPEKEIQDHYGLGANSIPFDLLEIRTSGVTPAPAETSQGQRPIIPAVFPQAAVTWLGIGQDRVPTGDTVYTVLSTSATPGTPAEGAEQAHSTGAFTATVLTPARIQASMFYSREDKARFVGMDAAIRTNLSDAMADKLDNVVLSGTNGLFTGTVLPNNNASAADDYSTYRKRFLYDAIDGTWASESTDCRILVGSSTYGDMAATYRSTSDSTNTLTTLRGESSGVRVSAHVPDVASSKQNAVVRRGNRKDYAIGLWDGISLITDEITQAKAGEIVITAVMLYAVKVLRTDGFRKVQAQHA